MEEKLFKKFLELHRYAGIYFQVDRAFKAYTGRAPENITDMINYSALRHGASTLAQLVKIKDDWEKVVEDFKQFVKKKTTQKNEERVDRLDYLREALKNAKEDAKEMARQRQQIYEAQTEVYTKRVFYDQVTSSYNNDWYTIKTSGSTTSNY